MSEWKPIGTAPRDGTDLLLYELCDNGTPAIGQAYYCTEDKSWYEQNMHHTDFHDGSWATPTHWMPLPPPPVLKEKENQ